MDNFRLKFTNFLFDTLTEYDYVLLKFIEHSVFDVAESSDLDILIRQGNLKKILGQLKMFKGISAWKESRKSSMIQLFIYFEDGKFLQVDLLYKFIRTNLIYLDEETIIKGKVKTHEGIFTTCQSHLFEHVILFNFLNFARLSPKYIRYFSEKSADEQSDLLDYFNEKYKTNIQNIQQLEKFDKLVREKIYKKTLHLSNNQGITKLKNNIDYLMDKVKSSRQDKGVVISFSGVDGAGKTTIMDNTERLLKEKYKEKIIRLRHRPQVLPILSSYKYGKEEAEKRAAETMPRTGGNKSSIGSLVRFIYYYLDYILGQFVIYFKYTMKGYTILYDRYYFDFIVDFRRSNININPAIPKFLFNFVFKPNINIFLYASPEVILKRKQELPSEEIVILTKNYKALFAELDAKSGKIQYIAIENIVLEETMARIEEAFRSVK
ncbi:MAG: thymidylate kinase [Saprospiraceae bacterium]|jgi:thymidylate kinase